MIPRNALSVLPVSGNCNLPRAAALPLALIAGALIESPFSILPNRYSNRMFGDEKVHPIGKTLWQRREQFVNLMVGCLMRISSLLVITFLGAPKLRNQIIPPAALFRLMALEADCYQPVRFT